MAVGKRYKAARENINRDKLYPLTEAVAMVKEHSSAKFDETIEVALNLGVDPRHADQMVRGVINLPNGTGRTVRVAVFAKDDKAEEAKAAGADIVGAEDLMADVQAGKINFDRCIATPDMMPLVGRLGKVLGPRNLMPNPKTGTVTWMLRLRLKLPRVVQSSFALKKLASFRLALAKLLLVLMHLKKTFVH